MARSARVPPTAPIRTRDPHARLTPVERDIWSYVGPAPVAACGCGCVPPYPETRGYVARILGLLGGAGEAPPDGGLIVRLVE